jgi:hypothetical protein
MILTPKVGFRAGTLDTSPNFRPWRRSRFQSRRQLADTLLQLAQEHMVAVETVRSWPLLVLRNGVGTTGALLDTVGAYKSASSNYLRCPRNRYPCLLGLMHLAHTRS